MARNDWLKKTGFPYIIRDENDRLIGTIGIRSADKKEPEIGYWADTTPNSGGYVTNALLKLCEVADKAGYTGLCAYAMPDNLSSRGVLERAGFADMGVMPYQRAGDNLVVDAVKYVKSLSRT
jgi:RimJ/RimL family protein N-acetyltransferase